MNRSAVVRLAEQAQAATPGPWRADVLGSEGYAVTTVNGVKPVPKQTGRLRRPIRVARCGHEDWDTDKANAEFIAAASPDVVSDLCQTLLRLTDEEQIARVLLDHAYRPSVARGIESCACGASKVGEPGWWRRHLAAVLARAVDQLDANWSDTTIGRPDGLGDET
jgi:hypothetical protein